VYAIIQQLAGVGMSQSVKGYSPGPCPLYDAREFLREVPRPDRPALKIGEYIAVLGPSKAEHEPLMTMYSYRRRLGLPSRFRSGTRERGD